MIMRPFTQDDVSQMWQIIQSYEKGKFPYFEDTAGVECFEGFESYINRQHDVIVGVEGHEVIGFAYLDLIAEGEFGSINLVVRKRCLTHERLMEILAKGLPYFYYKNDLDGLVCFVRKDNAAILKVINRLGFKVTEELPGYRMINQEPKDFYIAVRMINKGEITRMENNVENHAIC